MKPASQKGGAPAKGRGATLQIEGRFDSTTREIVDDGWDAADEDDAPALRTTVATEQARSIIQRHDSPDLPFSQSLNPYRGCEHGCIYCYARPSHAYVNLSPGLDFETRLFAKTNAAALLRQELSKPSYRCAPIALGANTDLYQPIEREWQVTRAILDVLAECNHPFTLITKSALVERDLELLQAMAQKNLVQVFISITTQDAALARKLEPRAVTPRRRLLTLQRLSDAGIPCGVMVAPVIPFLTDAELESLLAAAHQHGAQTAGYTLLRLPYELKTLFKDWLETHYPLKAQHVMSRLRDMRDGQENDVNFATRFKGQGEFAQLLTQRFNKSCARLGLNRTQLTLNTHLFRPPERDGQMSLF